MILNGLSRVPVYGEGIDDIVGVVYAKDLMRAERDGHGDHTVGELMRAASFVPETKRIAELLPEMQAGKVHLSIVVDEYGGTAGLVTLEDLLEELVGEIVDEYDRDEAAVERLPGGDVRVNGGHADRRGQRPARRRAARGRLGHDRRADVPPARPRAHRGRAGRVRGPRPAGRAGGPPSHRSGAHRAAGAARRRRTRTTPSVRST